jgi:hypothetical protein
MEVAVFIVGSLILTVLAIGVGIILAPRIGRWGMPPEPSTRPQNEPPDDQP